MANLVLLVALQMPRLGRWLGRGPSAAEAYEGTTGEATPDAVTENGDGALRRMLSEPSGLPVGVYQRMTRLVSFMFIGAALVLAVVTGSNDQTEVILLLAFGLILIELFQDVLPTSAMGKWRMSVEGAIALVFLTALIFMTGGHSSPYFFGYILLVGAAALSVSEFGGVALAVVSSIAYVVAVVAATDGSPLGSMDIAQVAFNLISIALTMYVASVVGHEQRRARDEALRLSRFDSLTKLHSRAYFMSELETEILRAARTGRSFAVAMIDLDGLKSANDHFGHDWGDNLLKAVADVMRGDIRVTDVAARYGGDEFVLMLTETDLSGAILVGEKVRVDISRVALAHNGAVVRTSASIGIVTFPDDGRTSAELMRRADQAMYEAKRRGRDQIVRFARDEAASAASAAYLAVGQRAHMRSPGQGPALSREQVSTTSREQVPMMPRQGHVSTLQAQSTAMPDPIPEIRPTPFREPMPPVEPPAVRAPALPPIAAASARSIPAASPGPAPWEIN